MKQRKKDPANSETALITTTAKETKFRNFLTSEAMMKEFARALPKHLTPERLVRVAITAMQENTKLWGCSDRSLVASILQSCQLGLEPDGVLGHAYLIPYAGRATLQIGYRGLIELAHRSGRVSGISAEVVHEKDEFEITLGTERKIRHIPNHEARDKDPGMANIRGVYAVVQFKDGYQDFEYLTFEMVEDIKSNSKAKDDGPWVTHWVEMARKTAIRKLAKRLPLSPEMTRAAVMDEYHEQGFTTRPPTLEIEVEAQREAATTGKPTESVFPDEREAIQEAKEKGLDKPVRTPEALVKLKKDRAYLSALGETNLKVVAEAMHKNKKITILKTGEYSIPFSEWKGVQAILAEAGIRVVEDQSEVEPVELDFE